MTEIRGKRVVVTGAAMGMGRLMALRFGELDADVVVVDIDEEGAEETRDTIESAGGRAEVFVCDLSKREAVDSLAEGILKRGPVDILVNNAGVVAGGLYEEIDDERDALTMDVNIRAVHWLTKRLMHSLKSQPDSHIVNMASGAGLMGTPHAAVYSASKWFVVGLTESLRLELKTDGHAHVGVTAVCPGLVNTGMFEGAKAPFLTKILDPEFMVDRIVEAIETDRPYVKEPFMLKLSPILREVLPTGLVDDLMDRFGATRLMHGFKGRD